MMVNVIGWDDNKVIKDQVKWPQQLDRQGSFRGALCKHWKRPYK